MAKKNYNRIKVVLVEKGMTNIELAKKLDKNQQTISRWCTNDSQPSVETLFQIAQVLGVKAKDLLND
ncbi:helix-turn-helix transcriptional regulator [uncultured Chitinophaga sp.]|jgi:transcriptional regulator with XRE-family HTH domain|uniref:helix-turn-helix transcriptional regulator n=1 Tax=uncultured Chitinophaga sp. TaxID=339340 RepID=UPI00262529EA|nr:helix-turn-helix transcriptional regulator [uncultured Chitinophaga sp.]